MLTMTMHNYFKNDPDLNIICIHPGWIRMNTRKPFGAFLKQSGMTRKGRYLSPIPVNLIPGKHTHSAVIKGGN